MNNDHVLDALCDAIQPTLDGAQVEAVRRAAHIGNIHLHLDPLRLAIMLRGRNAAPVGVLWRPGSTELAEAATRFVNGAFDAMPDAMRAKIGRAVTAGRARLHVVLDAVTPTAHLVLTANGSRLIILASLAPPETRH